MKAEQVSNVIEKSLELEQIEYRSMLYDFYGELLTQHQKNIYEDAVFNDLSLGEIADEQGISRQGVHDLIKRCDKILNDYEDKLHLVGKFTRTFEPFLIAIKEITSSGDSGAVNLSRK